MQLRRCSYWPAMGARSICWSAELHRIITHKCLGDGVYANSAHMRWCCCWACGMPSVHIALGRWHFRSCTCSVALTHLLVVLAHRHDCLFTKATSPVVKPFVQLTFVFGPCVLRYRQQHAPCLCCRGWTFCAEATVPDRIAETARQSNTSLAACNHHDIQNPTSNVCSNSTLTAH